MAAKRNADSGRPRPANSSAVTSASAATSPPAGSDPATQIPDALSRTKWLVIAAVIFGIWGVLLFSLAQMFANPVTINRRQIRQADIIVAGEVNDPVRGTFKVERSWKTTKTPEIVQVTNLLSLGKQRVGSGARVILALTQVPEATTGKVTYKVTSVTRGDGVVSHYVYPFNPPAIEQLEAVLNEQQD